MIKKKKKKVNMKLVVPCRLLRTEGDVDFEVVAPTLWNALLKGLHYVASAGTIKRQLKMH